MPWFYSPLAFSLYSVSWGPCGCWACGPGQWGPFSWGGSHWKRPWPIPTLAMLMGFLSPCRQEVQVQFQPEAQVSEGSLVGNISLGEPLCPALGSSWAPSRSWQSGCTPQASRSGAWCPKLRCRALGWQSSSAHSQGTFLSMPLRCRISHPQGQGAGPGCSHRAPLLAELQGMRRPRRRT